MFAVKNSSSVMTCGQKMTLSCKYYCWAVVLPVVIVVKFTHKKDVRVGMSGFLLCNLSGLKASPEFTELQQGKICSWMR